MQLFLIVAFAVIGSAYSRSLPIHPIDVVEIDSLPGYPVNLIRKACEFGGRYNNGGGGGGYNDFDYNPYNDSPRNYDGNPFNDLTHRQLYNNFDQNPFNNSPNVYDDDWFRRRFNL